MGTGLRTGIGLHPLPTTVGLTARETDEIVDWLDLIDQDTSVFEMPMPMRARQLLLRHARYIHDWDMAKALLFHPKVIPD